MLGATACALLVPSGQVGDPDAPRVILNGPRKLAKLTCRQKQARYGDGTWFKGVERQLRDRDSNPKFVLQRHACCQLHHPGLRP